MAEITAKSISQHKLRRYVELKKAAEELEILKAEIKGLIKSGLPCQPGRYSVKLSRKAGCRRPAWKDHGMMLARKHGVDAEEWAEKIISQTPRGAPSESIEVFDRDNPQG